MATTSHFTTVEKFEAKLAKLATNHSLDYSEADEVILTRRLEDAYNEILSALAARGLSVVQISTWARGEEFQLDIATFWYAKDSGWGGKLEDEIDWTKVFDRRAELKTVAVIDNDGTLLSQGSGIGIGIDLEEVNDNLGIYS